MSSARQERLEELLEFDEASLVIRAATTPAERQCRFYIHLAVYAVVVGSLAAMNLTWNPDHMWFHWVALGWGIGVVGHAVRAFRVVTRERADQRHALTAVEKLIL